MLLKYLFFHFYCINLHIVIIAPTATMTRNEPLALPPVNHLAAGNRHSKYVGQM